MFLPKTWMDAAGSVNTTWTPGSTVNVTVCVTSIRSAITIGLWNSVHTVSVCVEKAKILLKFDETLDWKVSWLFTDNIQYIIIIIHYMYMYIQRERPWIWYTLYTCIHVSCTLMDNVWVRSCHTVMNTRTKYTRKLKQKLVQRTDLHRTIYDGDRRVTVDVRMPAAKQLDRQRRKTIGFNRVQYQVATL